MMMKIKVILITALCCFGALNGLNGQDMFPSRQLTDDPAQQGFPSWSPDGKFLVYSYADREDTLGNNGLWVMNNDGQDPAQLLSGVAEHPKWSPDGNTIIFDADTGQNIKMVPAEGGEAISFLPDSIHIFRGGLPCWSPDGSRIAFLEGTTLRVFVYHLKTGLLTKIFDGQGQIPLPGCWSQDGKSVLLALWDRESNTSTMWKVAADGKEREQIKGHHKGLYRYMALSPDGTMLVYAAAEERNLGLWIMPAKGGKSIQLVSHPGFNESPCWHPDGKQIAFTSTRSGSFDIWLMDVDMEEIRIALEAD